MDECIPEKNISNPHSSRLLSLIQTRELQNSGSILSISYKYNNIYFLFKQFFPLNFTAEADFQTFFWQMSNSLLKIIKIAKFNILKSCKINDIHIQCILYPCSANAPFNELCSTSVMIHFKNRELNINYVYSPFKLNTPSSLPSQ